jgi:hypothetical protein
MRLASVRLGVLTRRDTRRNRRPRYFNLACSIPLLDRLHRVLLIFRKYLEIINPSLGIAFLTTERWGIIVSGGDDVVDVV